MSNNYKRIEFQLFEQLELLWLILKKSVKLHFSKILDLFKNNFAVD